MAKKNKNYIKSLYIQLDESQKDISDFLDQSNNNLKSDFINMARFYIQYQIQIGAYVPNGLQQQGGFPPPQYIMPYQPVYQQPTYHNYNNTIVGEQGQKDSLVDTIVGEQGQKDSLVDTIVGEQGQKDSPVDTIVGEQGQKDSPVDTIVGESIQDNALVTKQSKYKVTFEENNEQKNSELTEKQQKNADNLKGLIKF